MSIFQFIITKLIKGYQITISPWVGWHCRFDPSCSEYMRLAIIKYGVLRGIGMGIKRLGRCHPWGGYGYDPPGSQNNGRTNED